MLRYLSSEQISAGKPAWRWTRWPSISSNVSCDWRMIHICAAITFSDEITTLGCTRPYSVFTQALRERALCSLRRCSGRYDSLAAR
ncbi:hypothetical protein MLPF_0780 [Mycobacterium lepromatosis]|nr:hypothetical protein MLPF_0780 [Mycobacterium lepromatosis]